MIEKLHEEVIAQIAAGQIVDKPSDIVKELIENSIDANATKIEIDLIDNGLSQIKVIDNGSGISLNDLKNIAKRHYTSKIVSGSDLANVRTFGFRGEAIYAINNIGDLAVTSKISGESAGYTFPSLSPTSSPVGTAVTIENLFKSTPVRKKDLAKPQTLLRNIMRTLTLYAISYPEIQFSLIHNGKKIFFAPKSTFIDRLADIYGELYEQMIPIQKTLPHLKISGYIGLPHQSASTNTYQFLLINSRPVSEKNIISTINLAYKPFIDPRTYPLYVIKIKASHHLVDVNIDPKKEEVKLISLDDQVTKFGEYIKGVLENSSQKSKFKFSKSDEGTASLLKKNVDSWRPEKKSTYKFLSQLNKMYLLIETKKGLLIIDQHAAHERILYEQYLDYYSKLKTKNLKEVNIKLKLPKDLEIILENYLDEFRELGFEIENSKLIKLPKIFETRDINKLFIELLEDMQKYGGVHIDSKTNETLSFLACKHAIKAGDKLEVKESRSLVKKFFESTSNHNCPHGRPIVVEIDNRELDKHFKRI